MAGFLLPLFLLQQLLSAIESEAQSGLKAVGLCNKGSGISPEGEEGYFITWQL